MKINIFYTLISCLTFSISYITLNSQITVASSSDANALVEEIIGDGIEYSNATLISAGTAVGTFADGLVSGLGIDDGVLLTSGSVNNAPGPNSQGNAGTSNGGAGDADLEALITTASLDAAVLEFDFVAEGDMMSFNYVFASEEYDEFFCSNFNDVFAFFVTGPNPLGGNYSNLNIALIPGTTTPVSINNVGAGTCNGVNNSGFYNNNAGSATIQYDAFLDVFSASLDLVPCQTYHLKFAISDAGDRILDSGVFLEKGSLNSNPILANADVTDESCPNANNGAIDLEISGGEPPYSVSWADGPTVEDRSDLEPGEYEVTIEDQNGCEVSETYLVAEGIDTTGPDLSCTDITVSLDENGEVSIVVDDLVISASDECTPVSLELSNDSWSCEYGDFTVTVTASDTNGNSTECTPIVTVLAPDDDCDSVPNQCDVCDGGDDTVDNNNDGLPDCKYPPSFDDIIDEWKCGKNLKKVLICHIPPGNPGNAHTICVSKNAIQAHIDHGCYIGPCGNASCGLGSLSNHNDNIEIYPNPTSSEFVIAFNGATVNNEIVLINSFGNEVYRTNINHKANKLVINVNHLNLNSGLYFVKMEVEGKIVLKKVFVQQ